MIFLALPASFLLLRRCRLDEKEMKVIREAVVAAAEGGGGGGAEGGPGPEGDDGDE